MVVWRGWGIGRIARTRIREIDRYHPDQISLGTLISNLQGHFNAVNVHDPQLIEDFRSLLARMDGEHEVRADPWAPPDATI